MRKLILAASALAVSLPVSVALPTTAASAQERVYKEKRKRYYCRKHGGTTGAIVGGGAGALLGNAVIGGVGGTVVGAAGGALAGRAIERNRSTRNCR